MKKLLMSNSWPWVVGPTDNFSEKRDTYKIISYDIKVKYTFQKEKTLK